MGLFSNFLKSITAKVSGYYGYRAKSSPWSSEVYEQETVRAIVDAIATHAAKGQAMHVVLDKDGRIKEVKRNSPYAKLLNQKANPLHTGYDLKYKLVAQLESKGTAVCYIKWDGTTPTMMIPINYGQFEIYPIIGGGYALQFLDDTGTRVTINAEDVVILRRMMCESDVAGDGNRPIYNTLSMIKASDEGFIEALTVSNKVRGLYKHKKAMLDPKDVTNSQNEFASRFEDAAKNGGIVGVDSLEDYTPLNVTAYSANAAQMKTVRESLFIFWRTPEEIVKSSYSEQQGMAWYESKIEPIWASMGEAFTNACFTAREYDVGNRIIFSGGALMGTSYNTRINVIQQARDTGLLTVNEQRELLGYPPVEGGDKRQVSLNYVDADKQNEYQKVGGQNEPEQPDDENDNGPADPID